MTSISAPLEPALRSSDQKSYWSIVAHAYWRGTLARIATFWVAFTLFLTIFVPFIANESPYTAIIDGKREFPLFRNLTRVDWIWLVWGTAIVIYAFFHRRSKQQSKEIEELLKRRWMSARAWYLAEHMQRGV